MCVCVCNIQKLDNYKEKGTIFQNESTCLLAPTILNHAYNYTFEYTEYGRINKHTENKKV